MRKLDYKDIQYFYNCHQEQLGASIGSNLTDQIIDQICDNTINKINGVRVTSKYIINAYSGSHLSSISFPEILNLLLDQNCIANFLELTNNRIKPECGLGYFPDNDPEGNPPHNMSTEHQMWAWAVFFISWTLRNLKGKVDVGSCHTETHRCSPDKMHCPQGSKFHLDFYNDCLQLFKHIINGADLNPPIPTDLLLSKYHRDNAGQLTKLVNAILRAF